MAGKSTGRKSASPRNAPGSNWYTPSRSAILLLVAVLAAPAAATAHKIKVWDSSTAKSIQEDGGQLLADYGSYQFYEVDRLRPRLLQSDTVEVRDDCNRILLNAAGIDTSIAATKAVHRPAAAFGGKRLHLIQFVGPVQSAWHKALRKTGAQIINYIPENAYLVYGDAQSLAKVQGLTDSLTAVQWDGDYQEDYKIHPNAKLLDEKGHVRQLPTDTFAIQLVEDPDANPATLALVDRLKLAPIRRRYNLLRCVNLFVRLRPQDLATIAAQPDVISIQPYTEPKKQDERQDQIVAGNLSGNTPTGPGYLPWLASMGFTQAQFTASGFVVDISDSGIDDGTTAPGHFALYALGDTNNASRVVYNRLEGTPNNPGSTIQGCDGHGNINAHIVCGYDDQSAVLLHTDSGGYHYGLGVCPFVNVGSSVIFDPANFTNPDYADLMSEAYHDGARISNNSWGSTDDGLYNSDSQAYDALVRDAQPTNSTFFVAGNQEMVIVFSDGDDGPGARTVSPPSTAKNIIAVGGTENVRSLSPANGGNDSLGSDGCGTSDADANSANDIATFSGRGPCFDGRIKPDIVAPCTHITGGAPQSFPPPDPNGTGSALPCFLTIDANDIGVCGLPGSGTVAADNFFPGGQQFFTVSSGTSHSAPAVAGACALLRQYFFNQSLQPPSPAMTKAYLMNSARYVTGSGANDNLWSVNQGMGELDLGTAFDGTLRTLRDELAADKFTGSGQTKFFSGTINDSFKPFRTTLVWTDTPGSTIGNALNNDLDLTVLIGGKTYKGNVFSGNHSVTGGSADHLNNVESVFLPAGTIGNFTVTITAANIDSDGVPGDADPLDQDFALVIYNGTAAPGSAANFAAVAGVYRGLVQSNSPSQQTSGVISITAGTTGAFSAKLTMGGASYSFKGGFNNNGDGTSVILRAGATSLTVMLHIDLTNGTDQITGTVSDGTFTSDVTANLSVFNSRSNPAMPYQGSYTVLLLPNPGDTGPDFPQGNGYGTIKLDAGGKIRFSATLGDGTRVSQSAIVSRDGAWPLYVAPYARQGLLSGWVTFTNIVGVSDLGGTLSWFKPPTPGARFYPNRFATQIALLGSRYAVPTIGTPALTVSNTACNLLVTSGAGDLASFVSNPVTLNVNNKVSLCGTNGCKLTITTRTGLFSGSFVNPATAKSTAFRGALFQKQNDGAGLFLGADQTGFVTVEPAP